MTGHIEDLPGLGSIFELNDTEPDKWWRSSRLPICVRMTPELYPPIKILLSKTPNYQEHYRGRLSALLSQLETLALPGAPYGSSPYQEAFTRAKSGGAAYFQDATQSASDFEDFLTLVDQDLSGANRLRVPFNLTANDDDYRYALAYFALKGVAASVSEVPHRVPKKREQREAQAMRAGVRPLAETSTVPIDGWLPANVKQEVAVAASLLADAVEQHADNETPFDLLDSEFWGQAPTQIAQKQARDGLTPSTPKAISRKFSAGSDDLGRYFTVVYYILIH